MFHTRARRVVVPLALLAALAGCTDAPPPVDDGDDGNGTVVDTPAIQVPAVTGLAIREARGLLRDLGLGWEARNRETRQREGTVLGQRPAGGREVEEGTIVTLTVAKPLPRIPRLLGLTARQARRILRDRGFKLSVREQPSDAPVGTVISQRPSAQVRRRTGTTVLIVKASPRCHPSYAGGCLDPNAFDYDCAGGTGDGPKYTGTVRVVGPDVFGLDADNDGVGCE